MHWLKNLILVGQTDQKNQQLQICFKLFSLVIQGYCFQYFIKFLSNLNDWQHYQGLLIPATNLGILQVGSLEIYIQRSHFSFHQCHDQLQTLPGLQELPTASHTSNDLFSHISNQPTPTLLCIIDSVLLNLCKFYTLIHIWSKSHCYQGILQQHRQNYYSPHPVQLLSNCFMPVIALLYFILYKFEYQLSICIHFCIIYNLNQLSTRTFGTLKQDILGYILHSIIYSKVGIEEEFGCTIVVQYYIFHTCYSSSLYKMLLSRRYKARLNQYILSKLQGIPHMNYQPTKNVHMGRLYYQPCFVLSRTISSYSLKYRDEAVSFLYLLVKYYRLQNWINLTNFNHTHNNHQINLICILCLRSFHQTGRIYFFNKQQNRKELTSSHLNIDMYNTYNNQLALCKKAMQRQQPPILSSRLKCGIIKDLFSQILKNTKSSNTFYLNISEQGLKMIFMEKDKEVQIFISLSKEMFQIYNFNSEQNQQICKFDIKDLDLIGVIFENQSALLELVITESSMKVSHSSEFLGDVVYRIAAHDITQQIPQQVINAQATANDDEPHTKIQISKMKNLSKIIHTFSLQKIERLQIHFRSVNHCLQIVPIPQQVTSSGPIQESNQTFLLQAKYLKTQMLDHLRFNVKKFKTCLGLFDKKNKIIVSFFRNCAKLEAIEKDKKDVQIILACAFDA